MVSEPLRKAMLLAAGSRRLSGPDVVTATAEHPVCGDVVEFDCRLRDRVCVELAWRAEGCPATMAVAAVVEGALSGHPIDQAEPRLRQHVAALGGLATGEAHALAMALRALACVAAS